MWLRCLTYSYSICAKVVGTLYNLNFHYMIIFCVSWGIYDKFCDLSYDMSEELHI